MNSGKIPDTKLPTPRARMAKNLASILLMPVSVRFAVMFDTSSMLAGSIAVGDDVSRALDRVKLQATDWLLAFSGGLQLCVVKDTVPLIICLLFWDRLVTWKD